MTSKSPFKKLLDAWTKKPFWELRDIEKPRWGEFSENPLTPENQAIQLAPNETAYRTTDFEPIFNRSGSALKGVLYRPLLRLTALKCCDIPWRALMQFIIGNAVIELFL